MTGPNLLDLVQTVTIETDWYRIGRAPRILNCVIVNATIVMKNIFPIGFSFSNAAKAAATERLNH